MKTFPKTKSNVQPEPMIIDDYSVWVAENIVQTKETATEDHPEIEGYEYDLTQYTKDEYILMMANKNKELESTITDTQLAMVEIYESLS